MGQKNNFKRLLDFDLQVIRHYDDCLCIGIDEVGRGALAGPVIACAFSWKIEIQKLSQRKYIRILSKLNDSKQLTRKNRDEISKSLVKYGDFAVGYASIYEIETLNILQATYLAMKRAFDKLMLLKSAETPFVLIDGNKFNPFINCMQIPVIGGDAKSSLIASASIIAKVYRDTLMSRIGRHEKYKCFGWQRNAGYGTAFHSKAIKSNGLSPLHRKLFVRKITALQV